MATKDGNLEEKKTKKLSPELYRIACYYLGLSKRMGNFIDVCTSQGLDRLNALLYLAYGYTLVEQKIKLFPDPIFALASGPSMITSDQAKCLVPFVVVSFEEMKQFPFDIPSYVSYLSTLLKGSKVASQHESLESFMKRVENKEIEMEQEQPLRHELRFFVHLKQIHSDELTALSSTTIEFWFNTPDHPFEKSLENLYSKNKM